MPHGIDCIDCGECNVGNPVKPHSISKHFCHLVGFNRQYPNKGVHMALGLQQIEELEKTCHGWKLKISTDVLFFL